MYLANICSGDWVESFRPANQSNKLKDTKKQSGGLRGFVIASDHLFIRPIVRQIFYSEGWSCSYYLKSYKHMKQIKPAGLYFAHSLTVNCDVFLLLFTPKIVYL